MRYRADWCARCPTKISLSASNPGRPSRRHSTIVRNSSSAAPAAAARTSVSTACAPCRASTPSYVAGSGLTPDDGLSREVLGDVGDEPVLADADHNVLGLEQE